MKDHIDVTPRMLNFQPENGDAPPDKSKRTDRDTEQPTPVAPPDAEVQDRDVTPIGNLPGVTILPADLKLMEVYGDYIHQNDGTHMDGGIQEDGVHLAAQ
jgi:hypothetical protein